VHFLSYPITLFLKRAAILIAVMFYYPRILTNSGERRVAAISFNLPLSRATIIRFRATLVVTNSASATGNHEIASRTCDSL
jgi:hypothetical protein